MIALHTCAYTPDGLDGPACGAPATIMNPRSRVDFDYEEWFCRRHADPAWPHPGPYCDCDMCQSRIP